MRSRRNRGFTLIELMLVVAIVPVLVAACGALWVQGRELVLRLEAGVRLEREANIVVEWLKRDLHNTGCLSSSGASSAVRTSQARASATPRILDANGRKTLELWSDRCGEGEPIRYAHTERGLVRTAPEGSLLLSPHGFALETSSSDSRSMTVDVTLARQLPRGRMVAVDRRITTQSRKKPRSPKRRRRRGERGSVILLGLMVLASMTTMVTIGLRRRTVDLATETRALERVQARWAAESAVVLARGGQTRMAGQLRSEMGVTTYAGETGSDASGRWIRALGTHAETTAHVFVRLDARGSVRDWIEGPDDSGSER